MKFLKSDFVALAVAGAIVTVTPTVGLGPARQSRLDAAALQAQASELREDLHKAIAAAQSVRQSIEHEKTLLAAMTNESVERIPLNRRIAMVNSVAEQCGLEVTRLSPKREQSNNGQEPIRGLDLSAMGVFPGVVRLLEALETPELSLWAQSFEIIARQDRPGWVTISTDIAWHADSAGD